MLAFKMLTILYVSFFKKKFVSFYTFVTDNGTVSLIFFSLFAT